jgi:hypothetical protein
MTFLLSIAVVVIVALLLPAQARVIPFTPFRRKRQAPAVLPIDTAGAAERNLEVSPDGPILKQLIWAPVGPAAKASSHPTLAAIDLARGDAHGAFANAPDADALEQRARQIVEESWSELVWLTGLIDQARFDALCTALEKSRSLTGSDIELVVVRELDVQDHQNAR